MPQPERIRHAQTQQLAQVHAEGVGEAPAVKLTKGGAAAAADKSLVAVAAAPVSSNVRARAARAIWI